MKVVTPVTHQAQPDFHRPHIYQWDSCGSHEPLIRGLTPSTEKRSPMTRAALPPR